MCVLGSTPAMLGVPPFRTHALVEPVRWWKETDKKQEIEKDAGTRNAMQRHRARWARVQVTAGGWASSISCSEQGSPGVAGVQTPDGDTEVRQGTSQWKGIQARGDGGWTRPRVDLAWRLRMTTVPG